MRLAEQERINAEQGAVLEQLMEEIREGGGPVPGNWINYDASAKPLSAKVRPTRPSPRRCWLTAALCVHSRRVVASRAAGAAAARCRLAMAPRRSNHEAALRPYPEAAHRKLPPRRSGPGNPCSEAGCARRRGGRSAGGMMPDLSEMPEMPGVEPQDDGDDIYEAERSPARTTRVPSRGEPAGAAVSAPRRTKSPHDGGYSTAAKPPVSPAAAKPASSGGSRAPSAPAPAPAPPPSGGAVAIDPPAARTVRPLSAQTWML